MAWKLSRRRRTYIRVYRSPLQSRIRVAYACHDRAYAVRSPRWSGCPHRNRLRIATKLAQGQYGRTRGPGAASEECLVTLSWPMCSQGRSSAAPGLESLSRRRRTYIQVYPLHHSPRFLKCPRRGQRLRSSSASMERFRT